MEKLVFSVCVELEPNRGYEATLQDKKFCRQVSLTKVFVCETTEEAAQYGFAEIFNKSLIELDVNGITPELCNYSRDKRSGPDEDGTIIFTVDTENSDFHIKISVSPLPINF